MPSVSRKQANFFRAIAHSKEFAAKAGVPQSVGREFYEADKAKRRDRIARAMIHKKPR